MNGGPLDCSALCINLLSFMLRSTCSSEWVTQPGSPCSLDPKVVLESKDIIPNSGAK